MTANAKLSQRPVYDESNPSLYIGDEGGNWVLVGKKYYSHEELEHLEANRAFLLQTHSEQVDLINGLQEKVDELMQIAVLGQHISAHIPDLVKRRKITYGAPEDAKKFNEAVTTFLKKWYPGTPITLGRSESCLQEDDER